MSFCALHIIVTTCLFHLTYLWDIRVLSWKKHRLTLANSTEKELIKGHCVAHTLSGKVGELDLKLLDFKLFLIILQNWSPELPLSLGIIPAACLTRWCAPGWPRAHEGCESPVALHLERPCSWLHTLLSPSWSSQYFLSKGSCIFILHWALQVRWSVLGAGHWLPLLQPLSL